MHAVAIGWFLMILGVAILLIMVVVPAASTMWKEKRYGRHHEWTQWSMKAFMIVVIAAAIMLKGYTLLAATHETATSNGGNADWKPTHQKTISDIFK